ncbi:MAG: GIY-YIG nuclease family protein [Sphingopyxis sp.]|nr:GIY-YIG nuclease family protein [Sphingopyxis sp.]
MTFWAYMLHCRGGAFYVGHTDNLEYRIGQHQGGLIAGFTANHLPVELVWSWDFPTRHEAKEAERRIKGWSRAKKLALIRGDWDRISMLAKGKNDPSTATRREPGQTGEGENAAFSPALVQGTDPTPHPVRPELVEGLSFSLTPHPHTPPTSVQAVSGFLSGTAELMIEYRVECAKTLVDPGPVMPTRADELWRTTCFELFVKSADADGYTEYNFSPSSEWAAYVFDGYRVNMRNAPMHHPAILGLREGEAYVLEVGSGPSLPPGDIHLALAAVIEESDGTKSYWALAHPAEGPPDFHHPDCFALHLPAPDAA